MPELTQESLGQLYQETSDYAQRMARTSAGGSGGVGSAGASGWVTTTMSWDPAVADSSPYFVYQAPGVEFGVSTDKNGISPQLYFKYVKSKLGVLESVKLGNRLEKVKKAATKAKENGQDLLSQKILASIGREVRESGVFAKGIKYFIERDVLNKHKRNIRGGHISDTMFKDYTRVIPEDVLAKKKNVEDVFDDFVIYHYWNESAQKDVKNMDPSEKAKMRDPILFGIIKESNRLYFIADWEDEFCDLTFDELIDVVGKQEITKEVNLK